MTSGEMLYQGKAKSVYHTDDTDTLIVEFRDDITAFDGQKKDVLSGKGTYNAGVSAHFFELLAKKRVRTHYLRMLGPRTMLVRKLEMIPLEVIVRNIAAGSMVKRFPIAEGTPLSPPVIVLDYKDDTRHDPMLNDDIAFALGIVTKDELAIIKRTALRVNRILSNYLAERGITLVDFKLEFGRHNGAIVLGDEISMDSMRLWDTTTHRSLDKDVYRFDRGDVMSAYAAVARRIAPTISGGIV